MEKMRHENGITFWRKLIQGEWSKQQRNARKVRRNESRKNSWHLNYGKNLIHVFRRLCDCQCRHPMPLFKPLKPSERTPVTYCTMCRVIEQRKWLFLTCMAADEYISWHTKAVRRFSLCIIHGVYRAHNDVTFSVLWAWIWYICERNTLEMERDRMERDRSLRFRGQKKKQTNDSKSPTKKLTDRNRMESGRQWIHQTNTDCYSNQQANFGNVRLLI